MKRAIALWNRLRGPLLRFTFLQLMLMMSVIGLRSFKPPLPLFMVTCIAIGWVFGKHLIGWTWQAEEEKSVAMMREARERLNKIELLIQAHDMAKVQELLRDGLSSRSKKPEAPN